MSSLTPGVPPTAGAPKAGKYYSPSWQDSSAHDDYNPPPAAAPDERESPPDLGYYWPPAETSSEVPNVNALPLWAKDTFIGLTFGIGIVVLLVVVGVFVILRRRRTRRNRRVPPLQRPTDDPVGSEPQHWQYSNAPPPMDNGVVIQPKPTSPEIVSTNQLLPGCVPPPRETPSTSSSLGPEKPLSSLTRGISLSFSQNTFTYEELAIATDAFSDANFLGQGGFGYVHKGVLPIGKQVAIKQLKAGSVQGEQEFQTEVEIISRVHHKHLVSLVGYCISGAQRMLVYEFVPNNTLEFHLHDKLRPIMSWATRMKIALGSAKGLAYLHEDCQPKIIHRDIKAANILLDHNFEAKVADFGLAKFVIDDDTHISTQIKGTFGYLAPEYASSGKLTDKSDVFSFGVVLLELITGRRPIDKTHSFREDSMVDWARPLLAQAQEGGSFDSFVDPRLRDYNSSEMARMVACAAVCVHHSTRRRPRMSQIVLALEGHIPLDDLNDGISPGRNTVHILQEGSMTKPRK